MNTARIDPEEGSDLAELPADEEVSFLLVYLDHDGNVRHATLRSNSPAHEVRAKAREHRDGLRAYCAALGGILVSVQVTYERSQNLVGQSPRLRLVAGQNVVNGRGADLVRPITSLYSATPMIFLGPLEHLLRHCCC